MNFGDILDQWDNHKKKAKPDKDKAFEKLLDQYLPDEDLVNNKDKSDSGTSVFKNSRDLEKLKIDDSCDLHGLTLAEARNEVDRFLINCRQLGYKKVLIIHGKGNHSLSAPVLQKQIRLYLQEHRLAGRWGIADKKNGGNGATWVILR